jgi:cytochrome c oxidase subunit 4
MLVKLYGLLNLGSLFFGLVAWGIPVVFLVRKELSVNSPVWVVFFSLVSAMVSLFFQIIYTKHLVDIGDWSALLDTQGGVVFAASVLLFITVGLNVLVINKSVVNSSN